MSLPIDPVRVASWLFYINGGIWIALAALAYSRLSGGNDGVLLSAIIAVLMLGNSAAMVVAGIGVGRRSRRMWVFGVGILLVNIVLTFTDQVGWIDWATFGFDAVLLAVMAVVGYQFVAESRG